MIEATIISYLIEGTSGRTSAGKNVFAERPATPPEKFVIVEKTGSTTTDRITTATIVIQSYAKSMLDVISLNEEVKAAMYGLVTLDSIGACDLNSDYNYTDTSLKQYRYQAVFQIVHY